MTNLTANQRKLLITFRLGIVVILDGDKGRLWIGDFCVIGKTDSRLALRLQVVKVQCCPV